MDARPGLVVGLALMLAGCSSEPGSDPPGDVPSVTASSTLSSSGPVEPLAPPTTDTLRFLDIPDLTTMAATAAEPVLIDVPGNVERTGQADIFSRAMWTYKVLGQGNVSAVEAHIWLRIDRQVVNHGSAPETCAWALWVEARDPAGELLYSTRPCIVDAPVIPAGDRELVFDLQFEAKVGPGCTLGVGLDITPFDPAAPDAIRLLAGNVDLDSRVVWAGLQEPVQEPV